MAKRTAIIDIGSNSLSLVVYEKSSRFAFHLIEKVRASVRIGEGAYEKGGMLQEDAMDKAFCALKDFLLVTNNVKCRKVLCVATSALRDAPNKKEFIKRVEKELKLSIKIIDGKKEAYFGALAALNLLEPLETFTTIDIGGGSTELAKIEGGVIRQTLSLDIGTVRIKELFSDTKLEPQQLEEYIQNVISLVPQSFHASVIVGIGGTIRALSSAIMTKEAYPIENLHGFSYKRQEYRDWIASIPLMSKPELKEFDFPSSRLDTIREGIAIFHPLLEQLNAKEVIASKAGVREGVYLHDILRNSQFTFPENFNISIKSLVDRFALSAKNCAYAQRVSWQLFDTLAPLHKIEARYRETLGYASKLSPLSKRLNIYSNSQNSFYFFLENLNFMFAHEQKLLIALLLKLSSKEKHRRRDYKTYQKLLPSADVLEWLYFMFALTECINSNRKIQKPRIYLEGNDLIIMIEEGGHLARACIEKITCPEGLNILLKPSS